LWHGRSPDPRVEIVADHIGVIARPERLLKFAILGGVLLGAHGDPH